MRKVRCLVLGLLILMMGAAGASAQVYDQVFPGVACNNKWATDMYIMVDQSGQGSNPRWTMEAEYIPSRDNDTRYTTQLDLADYGNMLIYTLRDFICDTFPNMPQTGNGTLIIRSETPFYAWHKSQQRIMRYGAAVPPSFSLDPSYLYVWFGDTVDDGRYRFNVFFFNEDAYDIALVWVDNDLYALEPLESFTILDTASTGLIEIVQGNQLHVVPTMVDNQSNDGVIVPLIIRDLF